MKIGTGKGNYITCTDGTGAPSLTNDINSLKNNIEIVPASMASAEVTQSSTGDAAAEIKKKNGTEELCKAVKENEIENLISAFNKVLLTYKDPTIPGTGSQSGEMIKKGVPFYENKIRFDVFAAAANNKQFHEEIMNVISCCKEYQTLGKCVHKDKPKVNCSRNRTTPSPSSSSSSEDSESE